MVRVTFNNGAHIKGYCLVPITEQECTLLMHCGKPRSIDSAKDVLQCNEHEALKVAKSLTAKMLHAGTDCVIAGWAIEYDAGLSKHYAKERKQIILTRFDRMRKMCREHAAVMGFDDPAKYLDQWFVDNAADELKQLEGLIYG